MSGQGYEQLTLFQGDSPASRLVLPGSEEAVTMTVTSGQKCLELYNRSDPVGWLVKMLLGSSIWSSTRCYLTWKEQATPAKRWFFRLVPSTLRTEEIECALLPTITGFDAECGDLKGKEYAEGSRHAINPHMTKNGTIRHIGKNGGQSYARLDAVAEMYATPTARSWKTPCDHPKRKGRADVQTQVGGQLNPDWVEWMMGFPVGWTEV